MKPFHARLTTATLLGFVLLTAGCGDSGSSVMSQSSTAPAQTSLKSDEVVADRGMENTVAAGTLARVDAPSGDVTMERCMAKRRYLVFHTNEALDAVNDTNGVNDVYLRDLLTGTVTLVSKNSAGVAGNGASSYATISLDGKRIAYQSLASDLVAGDTNSKSDVFLYTRVDQATTRVSLTIGNTEAPDDSSFPALSSNGSFVTFVSKSDLTGVGTGGIQNLYMRKVDGSTTKLFSRGSGTGASANIHFPVMSSDSRYIAYMSQASNLVAGDTNNATDVFLFDRSTGLTERVSLGSSGQQADGSSSMPSISDDGNVIAFESKATNLVPGDSNGLRDVFVRNRSTGTTTRVSVDSSGRQGNGISYHSTLTRDGSRVAFASQASNLVGDTNNVSDVFQRLVADPASIARASRNIVGDLQGDGPSDLPSYDSDDNDLAFRSSSTNLDWANTVSSNEIFLANRASGTVAAVGPPSNPTAQKISNSAYGPASNTGDSATTGGQCFSADGRYQVFTSFSANLIPYVSGNMLKIYVKDRLTGLTVQAGEGFGSLGGYPQGQWDKVRPAISGDGQYVASQNNERNRNYPATSQNYIKSGINLFDLRRAYNVRVTPVDADGDCYSTSMSFDGGTVVFTSNATNLVPNDTNGCSDVFRYHAGAIKRISVDSAGEQGNGASTSGQCAISGDGRFVSFTSDASNLTPLDNNNTADVFVHDCQTGVTSCVSKVLSGPTANRPSREISISSNGRYAAFVSHATDLDALTSQPSRHIYIRDLQMNTVEKIGPETPSGYSNELIRFSPSLSADGSKVFYSALYYSENSQFQFFAYRYIHDRNSRLTVEIPSNDYGAYIDGAEDSGMSSDGRFVTWNSASTSLIPNDVNSWLDVFTKPVLFP
jgi:hypothetical protein